MSSTSRARPSENGPVQECNFWAKVLRVDSRFRGSVAFVLSTSDAETDISRAYEQCVAGYMVKTLVGSQFSQIAKLLVEDAETIRMKS